MNKATVLTHKYNLRAQGRKLRSAKTSIFYELPAAPTRRKKRASKQRSSRKAMSPQNKSSTPKRQLRMSSTALQSQRAKLRKVRNAPHSSELVAQKALLKTRKGLRGKCSRDNDCRVGLVCSEKKRCRTRKLPPLKGSGGKCALNDDCREGLICFEKTYRCRKLRSRRASSKKSSRRSSARATAGSSSSRHSSP